MIIYKILLMYKNMYWIDTYYDNTNEKPENIIKQVLDVYINDGFKDLTLIMEEIQ